MSEDALHIRSLPPPDALVPEGTFWMGSDDGRPDERPAHAVSVGAFRIGLTPVARAQYAPFLAEAGVPPPPWWTDEDFALPSQPVVGVTWYEAATFADWLGRRHGGVWRLPTEAEWERAARGGLHGTRTGWGDEPPAGEIPEGPLRAPWEAGRGTPNGYGLFDMGTLVHEWCADWYAPDYYAVSPHADPHGPDEGDRRSSRGGSWRHHVRWSPASARSSLPPEYRYADYGFRVLREV